MKIASFHPGPGGGRIPSDGKFNSRSPHNCSFLESTSAQLRATPACLVDQHPSTLLSEQLRTAPSRNYHLGPPRQETTPGSPVEKLPLGPPRRETTTWVRPVEKLPPGSAPSRNYPWVPVEKLPPGPPVGKLPPGHRRAQLRRYDVMHQQEGLMTILPN